MSEPFQILAGFLDRFGDDVEGRASQDLPAGIQAQLRDLARGNLAEGERAELLSRLGENPAWIGRLAEEVKALRTVPGTKQEGG